jgi:HlyD family secretion protein
MAMFFILSFSACEKKESLVLSGTVESTEIEINSEVPGKVIEVAKEEGTAIKKGEMVASIDSSLQELVVKQQEAVVKLKQARLDELKAGTRPEQVRQAEASADTARTAVNTVQTTVDTAQINYKYWLDKYNNTKSLYDSGSASDNDLSDAQYKLDTAKQQLITAQKQLKSSQSQLQAMQSQLELLRNGSTNQAIQAAQADLEQASAILEQAMLTLSKYKVKSPIDGTLISRNINTGDMVNTGTSVATVSDLNNLSVRVYIPQKYINLVSLNQEIALKSIAVDGKSIKGRITYIASEAEFTPKNTETTEAKENTVFKLKIKILDNIEKLKPGITVDAYIPLK